MSNTMNICCDDCKETLWYGQTSSGNRYAYERDCRSPLIEFLEKHEDHHLHTYSDYAGDGSGIDTDGYKKYDIDSWISNEN